MKDLTKILRDGDEVYYTVTGKMHEIVSTKSKSHSGFYCIVIDTGIERIMLSKYGQSELFGECLIFPSKEERNWDNFKRKEDKLDFGKDTITQEWIDDMYLKIEKQNTDFKNVVKAFREISEDFGKNIKEEFKKGDWGLYWDDGDSKMIGQYWGEMGGMHSNYYPYIVANYDDEGKMIEGYSYEHFEKINIKDFI